MDPVERLSFFRGDTRSFELTMTLDDEDGVAQPWEPPVGSTLRCTGKRILNDPDAAAVFAKSLDDGITVVGNVATIALASEDTEDLAGDTTLHCDIQSAGVGFRYTVKRFMLVVTPDVTRTP